MHTDDSLAVNAVLHGDKDGYEKLVEKYKKMVYSIAWSHLGDPDLSEDAAQETFVKAYTYLGTLREPDKFGGWLARIARNVSGSLGRRIKRERAFHKKWAILESAEAKQHEDERESLSEQLWESFAKLPAIHREALTLFYVEGKSSAEASVALGISDQAMRVRLQRARKALRAQLEQMLEESLSDLQPGKGFTRSVFALLPLAPKGTAGAGLLAVFGKLSASVSFALSMATVWNWAFFSMVGRVEESSLADIPQNRAARGMIRRAYRQFAYVMFAINAAMLVLIIFLGMKTALQIMLVVDLCILLIGTGPRLLGRFSAIDIISSGIPFLALMFAAPAAVVFFNAPVSTCSVAMIVIMVIFILIAPRVTIGPEKVGYNLFLRQAKGLPEVPEVDLQLSHELSRLEMRAFAKLLAELRLARRDYRFDGDSIHIFLHDMGFGLLPSGSQMTIGKDGECTATMSDADLQVIRRMVDPSISESDLKEQTCRTIRYALSRFADGHIQEVHDILAFRPDQSSRIRVRNLRIICLMNIWFFGSMYVIPHWVRSKTQGLIGYIIDFGLILIVLAITLRINKRLVRSMQR